MKQYFIALTALSLLFACTPEANKPSGTDEPEGGKDKTVHVTGIQLNPTSTIIKEGESVTLVATVTPSNADNKAVSWSSSSDAVAKVDANGKVTGVKAGSATITATAEDGGKTATCAVTVQQNNAPSVTVGAEHVSAVSVELQGKAQVDNKGTSLVLGFQYYKVNSSDSPSVTTLISANADEDNNYTVVITGLEPSTTYCYWSFVRQNGQDTYGETKEFTTKDVASLLETKEASGIEAVKATLNAKLDLTDVKYKDLAYGFLLGTSESSLNTDIKCTEIKDKTITAPLTDLSYKTQYWYKAYVTLDSQTFYSEVKTFTTDFVPVESVSLDKTEYIFNTIGNTLTLHATVLPADATDKRVSWTSDKEDVATVDSNGRVTAVGNGTATIKATANDGSGIFASCSLSVEEKIDMGIKTSDGKKLYWSTRNLCESGFVTSPEDYGDYYAWGETEPKEDYSWSTYKWGNTSSDSVTFTKYISESAINLGTVDNKTVLEPEDDVAHVKLGGKWRMPTEAEWRDLRTMCTWKWITQNGIHGYKVSAANGNSIFLPAAGTPNQSESIVGPCGFYWSSSLLPGLPVYACMLYFYSGNVCEDHEHREKGLSVRPVSE